MDRDGSGSGKNGAARKMRDVRINGPRRDGDIGSSLGARATVGSRRVGESGERRAEYRVALHRGWGQCPWLAPSRSAAPCRALSAPSWPCSRGRAGAAVRLGSHVGQRSYGLPSRPSSFLPATLPSGVSSCAEPSDRQRTSNIYDSLCAATSGGGQLFTFSPSLC